MRCLPILLLLATAAPTAVAQSAPTAPPAPRSAAITDVRYRLQFDAAHGVMRSIGVQMTFAVRGSGPVLLSLPAWTPGAYEISDYARNVSGFSAVTGTRALRWDKFDPDTWRIHPDGASQVTVRFEARADSLDNAFNWARDDIALINGTNVFLYPEGQPLEFASVVTVQAEPQWRVVTGLSQAGNGDFTAPNYHELVDAPFFVGRFDLDSMQVAGRWMRLATYPAGSRDRRAPRGALGRTLRKSVPPQVTVFGETPWTTYTVMQICRLRVRRHERPRTPELKRRHRRHAVPRRPVRAQRLCARDLPRLEREAAPTRRPLALPVRRGAADAVALGERRDHRLLRRPRHGARRRHHESTEFLGLTKGKMEHVAQTAAAGARGRLARGVAAHPRRQQRTSTTTRARSPGWLLDILIRDATDNAASLDDVMRALYRSTYKAGRGFTADDWWGAVSRAARGALVRGLQRAVR